MFGFDPLENADEAFILSENFMSILDCTDRELVEMERIRARRMAEELEKIIMEEDLEEIMREELEKSNQSHTKQDRTAISDEVSESDEVNDIDNQEYYETEIYKALKDTSGTGNIESISSILQEAEERYEEEIKVREMCRHMLDKEYDKVDYEFIECLSDEEVQGLLHVYKEEYIKKHFHNDSLKALSIARKLKGNLSDVDVAEEALISLHIDERLFRLKDFLIDIDFNL